MEKIIHQIWVGPNCIPGYIQAYLDRMRDMHPDFEYRLWRDADVPPLPGNVQSAYDSWMGQRAYAFAADVLRVWVVHEFGGVYLDADFEPLQSLSGLGLENYGAFLLGHGGGDLTFPNGVFGMAAHSQLSQFTVDSISPVANWCGPSWLGDVVRAFFGAPPGTTNADLQPRCRASGWLVIGFYDDFHVNYMRHMSLASWYPENQVRLAAGLV